MNAGLGRTSLLAAVTLGASLMAPEFAARAANKTVPYVEPPPPTPPSPATPRPQGRLVPSEGALFGIHTTPDSGSAKGPGDMGITALEAKLGRKFDIDNHYYGWTTKLPGWREQWDIAEGRIPLISWMGGDTIEITQGKHDALIGQRADGIKALGAPVFLRWFWEMDGYRSSKSDVAHSPSDYIAAWRHMRAVFDDHGAANAVWVWCPVSLGFYRKTAQPFYPGDNAVDWVCADGYNWAPARWGTRYEPFQEIFQAFYDFGVEHHKPLMIGETGVQENNPGDKAKWLAAAHASVTAHFPDIEAFLYFDVVNGDAHNTDWRLASSTSGFSAYREIALDPYFNQPHQN
jgi:glycosyl hydrolase family 26